MREQMHLALHWRPQGLGPGAAVAHVMIRRSGKLTTGETIFGGECTVLQELEAVLSDIERDIQHIREQAKLRFDR